MSPVALAVAAGDGSRGNDESHFIGIQGRAVTGNEVEVCSAGARPTAVFDNDVGGLPVERVSRIDPEVVFSDIPSVSGIVESHFTFPFRNSFTASVILCIT